MYFLMMKSESFTISLGMLLLMEAWERIRANMQTVMIPSFGKVQETAARQNFIIKEIWMIFLRICLVVSENPIPLWMMKIRMQKVRLRFPLRKRHLAVKS